MEALSGLKITECRDRSMLALECKSLAERFVGAVYYQIFIQGFFHADPHPGNVHVDEDGRVMFLDWGLVGTLSPDMRRHSVSLILGLSQGRPTRIVDALLDLGVVNGHVDRGSLIQGVEQLRRRYYERELADFNLGQAVGDLLALAKHHRIRIPPEYALLAKTAMTVDGVVRHIDPHTSLVELGKGFGVELLVNRLQPQAWVPEMMDTLSEWSRTASALPGEINQALAAISRGEVRIVLEHKNLDKVLGHWERLVNRMALSFLLAALIIGSGLVVHRDHLDHMVRFPFGEYAFIAASLMGLWVIIGAMRRGKL
jgi:ubiquinone biosynthesis protein